MPTPAEEIKRGAYSVWQRMSAQGPTEVGALSAADRYWAAQLVRHRLAAVRSGRLTQSSRAADMANWAAFERGGRP